MHPWSPVVVQSLSHARLFVTPWTAASQVVLHYLQEFAQTHIHWVTECHPTISSSIAPFSSCPQSFPAPWCFPMSQLPASGGQSIRASASVPPMNIDFIWFPLGLIGLISLLSKGLSRVFSSTTVQKYQFFGTQPSLWSNSHIHTWLLEKPLLWIYRLLLAK